MANLRPIRWQIGQKQRDRLRRRRSFASCSTNRNGACTCHLTFFHSLLSSFHVTSQFHSLSFRHSTHFLCVWSSLSLSLSQSSLVFCFPFFSLFSGNGTSKWVVVVVADANATEPIERERLG